MSTSDLPQKLPYRQALPLEGNLEGKTFSLSRETHPEVISGRESIQHAIPQDEALEIPRSQYNGAIPSPEDISIAQSYQAETELPQLIEDDGVVESQAVPQEVSVESFLSGLGKELPVAQETESDSTQALSNPVNETGAVVADVVAPHVEHDMGVVDITEDQAKKLKDDDAEKWAFEAKDRSRLQELLASQG